MSGMTRIRVRATVPTQSVIEEIEKGQSTLGRGRKPSHLIIASFADDGPKQCSDLDVCRYNGRSMSAELGDGFSLISEARETHATPWGAPQPFFYGVFRRL